MSQFLDAEHDARLDVGLHFDAKHDDCDHKEFVVLNDDLSIFITFSINQNKNAHNGGLFKRGLMRSNLFLMNSLPQPTLSGKTISSTA